MRRPFPPTPLRRRDAVARIRPSWLRSSNAQDKREVGAKTPTTDRRKSYFIIQCGTVTYDAGT